MKLIKPSYEIISPINRIEILKKIEAAGRTCYKSEEKITESSASNFVEMILKRGHESVIEHESISVRFICDRGVSHEIVRHRLCSFSQECISGDTEIHKGITIKQLYDRKNSRYGKTHNKTISLKSFNENNVIVPNKINDVFYKGKQEVYEVKTKNGYSIKATLNHKFFTKNSFKLLKDLSVGDKVFVNRRKSLLIDISDNDIIDMYLNKKMNPQEIADAFSVSYRSILERLKKLKIFNSHLNDKNKEKYNKNHTEESYKKMSKSLKTGFKNGRIIWNKGVLEKDSLSVKKQGMTLRKHHFKNRKGNKNSNWNGGITIYRKLKESVDHCEACEEKNIPFEVHHIDKNRRNNSIKNLLKLCRKCHKHFHKKWYNGTIITQDEIVAIDYVGVEDTYDLEMKPPYSNYIANGFAVHNSTRYCDYSKDKFDNQLTFILPCWFKEIKEGEYHNYNCDSNNPELIWKDAMLEAEDFYKKLIEANWVPQQARSVLPNALKTEIVVTANLREWREIFRQRTSQAAHPQIREIMEPLHQELITLLPELFEKI